MRAVLSPSKPCGGSQCRVPGNTVSAGQGKAVLTVPAPCPWISSNGRLHRMAVNQLTQAWRWAGKLAVPHDLAPYAGPVHITAHIWKPRRGRYDPNNLWPTVKAVVDGFVDAGLLADDDHTHVIGPDMRHGGIGPACFILEIVPQNTPLTG